MKMHIGLFLSVAIVGSTEAAPSALPGTDCGGSHRVYGAMPGFEPAQLIESTRPYYPPRAFYEWSEGWVSLEFTVGQDGAPKDIAVLDAIGAREFVVHAVGAVDRWRYRPATQNGKPVEQNLCNVTLSFRFAGSERAADHNAFVQRYNEARELLLDRKYDDAIAIIVPALRKRLNLYEIAMGSQVAGLAYAKKSDWPNALFHMRHAVIGDLAYLDKEMRSTALSVLTELELRLGNLDEGFRAFERLRGVDPKAAQPDGILGKMVTRMKDGLAAPGPISIAGRLAQHPLVDAPAVWRHRLLRSKFSFQNIRGEVKTFALLCTNARNGAAVAIGTWWEVPASAGLCKLRVDGAPGATLSVVQEWRTYEPSARR